MTSKKLAVTDAPRRRSGSPSPVKVNADSVNPARCAYDVLWVFHDRRRRRWFLQGRLE